MTIATMALALAVSAAGGGAKEAPLFELVPVPPEYAAAPTPAPIPTGAKHKRRAKSRRAASPRRSPPPLMFPPPVYIMAPPPPSMAVPVPPPAPMAPSIPRPPGSKLQPRNPGSWVTNDDYPAAAIRDNMRGTVTFSLDVDATGRVSGCSIVKSSGWEVLDGTTCSILKRRARFQPAIGDDGTPIASSYTNRFRWELPIDLVSPMASWARVTRFAVNGEGEIMGCFTREFGAPPQVDTHPCDAVQQPDETALETLLGGSSGPRSLELVETHIPDGAPPPEGFTMPAGVAVATRDVRLTVGDQGYVRGCVPGAGEHPELVERYMDRCAPDWTYPASDEAGERFVTMRVSFVRR